MPLFPALSVLAQTTELHIAAAADLTPVLPVLAAEYKQQTGITLVPSFGSSATLTEQIHNGAPFDVFMSADRAHPEQLAAAGVTDGAPLPYAHGVLVLWARHDSPAQPISLEALSRPAVEHIAMANPTHAPYGLAAQQALQSLHLYDKLQPKLAIAENIAQTAQFAESGNAQAGLISLTSASTPHFREEGSFIPIPPSSYKPIEQCAVVIKASSKAAAARAFLAWLTSPAVQSEMHHFGLDPAR